MGIGPLFITIVLFVIWVPLQMLMKWFVALKKLKTNKCFTYLLKHGNRRFQVMTFMMEGTLEIGFTACITVIVVSRKDNTVWKYNQTGWDWFAYVLAIMALIMLIVSPLELYREAKKVHKTAAAELEKKQKEWKAEQLKNHDEG